MATFAQVLDILYSIYGPGPNEWRSKFKAKVQNFQKMGIPLGISAGKGKAINYGIDHVYQFVICLECADMGLTPSQILGFIIQNWKEIEHAIVAQIDNGNKIQALIGFASHELRHVAEPDIIIFDGLQELANSKFNAARHLSIINLAQIVGEVEPFFSSINLSAKPAAGQIQAPAGPPGPPMAPAPPKPPFGRSVRSFPAAPATPPVKRPSVPPFIQRARDKKKDEGEQS